MSRAQRHSRILEIISSDDVETQEELVLRLEKSGFPATQATVSRDIKELGLIKTMNDKGVYKYAALKTEAHRVSEKHKNVFLEAVIKVFNVNNIVLIKTLGGSAQAVFAVVARMDFPENLGGVAGDDTILLVCATTETAAALSEKLKNLFG